MQKVSNQGRATAQMVAEMAEVSRVAVSRAFNPEASLAPEKRARILEIARSLNYVPDRAARALKTKRSHLVGLIVPDVCSPWESQEIDALTTALQEKGFGAVLFKTRLDLELDEAPLRVLRSFNPDSVIVFPEHLRPNQLTPFLDRAVPIYIDHMTGKDELGGHRYDRLEVDLKPGMEQAVALAAGYSVRRIAYISGKPASEAETARRTTLTAALGARGLPPPMVMPGDFSYASGHRAALDLFRVEGGADVIFAANDESAFGAMDAIRHQLGLRIPEDIRILGFDDIAQTAWDSFNLTTVKIDLAERVQKLVRLILRRLNEPEAASLFERVATRLVVRGTVG